MATRAGNSDSALDWGRVDAMAPKDDEIPDGARTAADFMRVYNIHETTAERRAKGLVRAGVLRTGVKLVGRNWMRFYWPA
jgi:hypothetical protein